MVGVVVYGWIPVVGVDIHVSNTKEVGFEDINGLLILLYLIRC